MTILFHYNTFFMLLQLSAAVTAIFITAVLFFQDSIVGCGQFLSARADIRQN